MANLKNGIVTTEEKKRNESIGDAIADFIQNNRRGIVICLGVIVIAVAGCIAGFAIRNVLRDKALSTIEDFSDRYDQLVMDINDPEKSADVQTLLDELNAFAGNQSGYAAAQAHSIAASIYAEKKDWAGAEKSWTASAKAGAKTYLAPVALFNAAVAAEEQGKTDEAVTLSTESASYPADFPEAPRAQFAIGRLLETQGDKQGAIEAYRAVREKWSGATVWINLAQNRIIVLESSGS
jgi:predicted negative regulator of RcsB-dependent stress response